jgi:hypothetical protein
MGNRLSLKQAQALLNAPDITTMTRSVSRAQRPHTPCGVQLKWSFP